MAPEHLPIAAAALPWQLVLAFIVFNVVAGMISKRKQGQRQPRPGVKARPMPEAPADPRAESNPAKSNAAMSNTVESNVAEAQRRPDEARAGAGGETAKDFRTDILSELARQLGLELPEPSKPSSAKPSSAKPSSAKPSRTEASPSAQAPVRPRPRLESDDGEHIGTHADLIAARKASRIADQRPSAAAPPAPPPPVAPEPARPAASLAADFADPEALRKAFILKTVLDKPLALRPRR